jgi:hypothetical protein
MNGLSPKLKWTFLCVARFAVGLRRPNRGRAARGHIPHCMGGEPAEVLRRGMREYNVWMAARAQEAGRPKTDQPKLHGLPLPELSFQASERLRICGRSWFRVEFAAGPIQ